MSKKYYKSVSLALGATVLATVPAGAYALETLHNANPSPEVSQPNSWTHVSRSTQDAMALNDESGDQCVYLKYDSRSKTLVVWSNGGRIKSSALFLDYLEEFKTDNQRIVNLRFEGHVYLPKDSSSLFGGDYLPHIKEISGAVDFSGVEKIDRLFNLTKAAAINFEPAGLNFDSVTSAISIFEGSSDLTLNFGHAQMPRLQNLSSAYLNATNIRGLSIVAGDKLTNVDSAFNGAQNVDVDTSAWGTQNLTSLNNAFSNSNVNPDVSNWDTSNVVDMRGVFAGNPEASPDVSRWNTGNVTDMTNLFADATKANPQVGAWDVSKVRSFSGTFQGATSTPNVSQWDTSSAEDMSYMFYSSPNANPDVSKWNVSKVTDLSSAFSRTRAANPDVSQWNVRKVSNFREMFKDTYAANPNIQSWKIGAGTPDGIKLDKLLNRSAYNNAVLPNLDNPKFVVSDILDTREPINIAASYETWRALVSGASSIKFPEGTYAIHEEGTDQRTGNTFTGKELNATNIADALQGFKEGQLIRIEPKTVVSEPWTDITPIPDAPELKQDLIFYKGDQVSGDLKDYFNGVDSVQSIEYAAGSSISTVSPVEDAHAKLVVTYTSGAKRTIEVSYTVKDKVEELPVIPEANTQGKHARVDTEKLPATGDINFGILSALVASASAGLIGLIRLRKRKH